MVRIRICIFVQNGYKVDNGSFYYRVILVNSAMKAHMDTRQLAGLLGSQAQATANKHSDIEAFTAGSFEERLPFCVTVFPPAVLRLCRRLARSPARRRRCSVCAAHTTPAQLTDTFGSTNQDLVSRLESADPLKCDQTVTLLRCPPSRRTVLPIGHLFSINTSRWITESRVLAMVR